MPIPPYHARLRAQIGNDLIWAPGVSVIIVRDRAGVAEVLLQRRSDDGTWNPICGSVDPGEDPDLCAIREAKEEAGIDIAIDGLLAVRALPAHTIAHNQHQVQFLDLVFWAHPVGTGDEAHIADDESLAMVWRRVDDLPPLPERHRHSIEQALAARAGRFEGVAFGLRQPRRL